MGSIHTVNQPNPGWRFRETHLAALPVASTPPAALTLGSFKPSVAISSAVVLPTGVARYNECPRNHAASMGGIVDSCGEFMPGGEEGSPEFFKCAACEFHRNFHRNEIDGEWLPSGFSPHFYSTASKSNGSHGATLSPSTQHYTRTIFQPTARLSRPTIITCQYHPLSMLLLLIIHHLPEQPRIQHAVFPTVHRRLDASHQLRDLASQEPLGLTHGFLP